MNEIHESNGKRSPYRSDLTFPIGEGDGDPFGHRDYVDSIEAALKAVPDQFTLGLFGPWGSGKSSILGELERRTNQRMPSRSPAERWRESRSRGASRKDALRQLWMGAPRKTALVIFDAWRYDGDSLRREFIRSVAHQLKEGEALSRRFKVDKELEAFEVDVTRLKEARPRLGWAAVFSGLLSAIIVALVIGALYGLIAIVDPADQTRAKAEIALIAPLAAFIFVVAGRLVSPVQVQESRRRLEFPEQFTETFQAILDKVRVDRVVVAIDNLDRCSPGRVAEMLSTIKTFLEPALRGRDNPGAKSLCFIIAADDHALRRHLIAEEMAASTVAGKPLEGGDLADPGNEHGVEAPAAHSEAEELAREAVDEYLRKFFNGSIRITDMLEDDRRDFSRSELADFVAWREINDEDAQRLVELTAQGLKGNPRRIKQFVNNLELRLQLFQDRLAGGRIQIEPDVMMVAKLAILEEEFPDAYAALRNEPLLLARWHDEAERESGSSTLPSALIGFLRFTNDIETPYVAAYLSFKQSKHELTLPGYEEFIEYLDEANVSTLTDGMARMDSEVQARHVEAAREYFDGLIQRRAWAAAYGTSRSVIEVAALHGEDEALAAHVFDRVLTHPELRKRTIRLQAETLLRAGLLSLPEQRLADLVDSMITAAAEESKDRVFEVSNALASVSNDLGAEAKQKLKSRYAEQSLRDDLASYLAIVEAMPEIVSADSIAGLVGELAEMDSFPSGDARLRTALVALPTVGQPARLANRLLAALRSTLEAHRREEGSEYNQLIEATLRVLDLADDADQFVGMLHDIAETWEQALVINRAPSLELSVTACSANARADESYGDVLGRRVFDIEDRGERSDWAKRHFQEMAPHFKSGFLDRLRAGIAGELGDPSEFIDLAEGALDRETRMSMYGQAAREAIGGRRYGAAERLLEVLDETGAASRAEELAEQAQHEPGAFLDAGPEGAILLVEMQQLLAPDRQDSVAIALVDAFVDRRAMAPQLGPILGKLKVNNTGTRLTVVQRLVGFEGDVQNRDRREGILKAAFLIAGRRPSRARDAIEARLNQLQDSDGEAFVEGIREG